MTVNFLFILFSFLLSITLSSFSSKGLGKNLSVCLLVRYLLLGIILFNCVPNAIGKE